MPWHGIRNGLKSGTASSVVSACLGLSALVQLEEQRGNGQAPTVPRGQVRPKPLCPSTVPLSFRDDPRPFVSAASRLPDTAARVAPHSRELNVMLPSVCLCSCNELGGFHRDKPWRGIRSSLNRACTHACSRYQDNGVAYSTLRIGLYRIRSN